MPNRVIYWFQDAWAKMDDTAVVRTWNQEFYSQYGVDYYFFKRSKNGSEFISSEDKERYDEFVGVLANAISEGKEIYISLGEMGSKLMERPEILNALALAKQANEGIIKLIHGPHVDPDTRAIFSYAKSGIVDMFQSDEYQPHHFILVKRKDNSWFVADENPHSEGLWKRVGAEIIKVYRSIHRTWYVLDDSQKYYEQLMETFRYRESIASRNNNIPDAVNNYPDPMLRIIRNTLKILSQRFILQPRLVIADSNTLNPKDVRRIRFNRFLRWIKKLLILSGYLLSSIDTLFKVPNIMSESIQPHPIIAASADSRKDLVNIGLFYSALKTLRDLYVNGPLSDNNREAILNEVRTYAANIVDRYSEGSNINTALQEEAQKQINKARESDDQAREVVKYCEAQDYSANEYLLKLPISEKAKDLIDSLNRENTQPRAENRMVTS